MACISELETVEQNMCVVCITADVGLSNILSGENHSRGVIEVYTL